MNDELERAGRKLLLVEEHLMEEQAEQGGMNMTQVPVMSSGSESETEEEQQEEEREEEVFISTQVQGQLDDIAREEKEVHSFRKVLGRFALETQENIEVSAPRSSTVKLRKRGGESDNDMRARNTGATMKKSPRRRIKSITQFNAEQWELDKEKDRAQKMLSLLSGKSAKVRELVARLSNDRAAKTRSRQEERVQFAAFNASEWKAILVLLQEKLPKVSRTEIKSVQQYVYGNKNLWQASQSLPDSDSQDVEESETMLPTLEKDLDLTPVCTLSQIVDNWVPQNSDVFVAKDNVDTEVNIEVPSSETEHASQVSDSCDSGSLISFEEELGGENVLMQHIPILVPASNASFKKTTNTDQLIDLTQNSYDAVSTIVSPIRRNSIRTASIQVPATRTATFQDSSKQAGVKLHLDNSIYSGEGVCKGAGNLVTTDTLNVSTICAHNKDEIVIDSEDEKGEYSIVEISIPRVTDTEIPIISAPYDNRLETPFPLNLTLDTENPSNSQSASPSTKQLRQSLRDIGMKPCRNKVQILQAWDTLESKFSCDSDAERSTQLRQFLTDLIVKNRDVSTDLMEKIYTFEPIRFYQLKDWLTSLDQFTAMIDDSFIKNWADVNGIVFRNDTEEFSNSISLSQSQSQSTLQPEMELDSQPYSETF